MSSIQRDNINNAIRFNMRHAIPVGWFYNEVNQIPEAVFEDFPGLRVTGLEEGGTYAQRKDFVYAVLEYQEVFSSLENDGKLGTCTWGNILKQYAPVPSVENFFINGDKRVPCASWGDDVKLLTWQDKEGLDLHKDGGWSKMGAGRDIRNVTIHWGGLYPKHCRDVLANRDLSSHFGTGRNIVYQWLNVSHKGWHAGWDNKLSIGIDICQQPVDSRYDYYTGRGYEVERASNTTGRGNKRIITLDPFTAKATRTLVLSLCKTFGIPLQAPRGADGKQSSGDVYHGVLPKAFVQKTFRGVVGHHHLSKTKWDVACWWDQIFEGTPLG